MKLDTHSVGELFSSVLDNSRGDKGWDINWNFWILHLVAALAAVKWSGASDC